MTSATSTGCSVLICPSSLILFPLVPAIGRQHVRQAPKLCAPFAVARLCLCGGDGLLDPNPSFLAVPLGTLLEISNQVLHVVETDQGV